MMATRLTILAAALAALTGCQAMLDTPSGYVKLREPYPYDYKAVSSRGNVLAARTHMNEDRSADLNFWSDAVEHQKVTLDGMKLAAREDVRSTRGLDGRLFVFELGEGQGKTSYLVAVFVDGGRILTVEAGGPAEQIAADLPAIRQAMTSVR